MYKLIILKFNQPQVLLRNVWKHVKYQWPQWLTTILANAQGMASVPQIIISQFTSHCQIPIAKNFVIGLNYIFLETWKVY